MSKSIVMPQNPLPPSSAALGWSLTLVEPLLPTERRALFEAAMHEVVVRTPDWAATFFGGFATDVMLTLPEVDPWRLLSGKVGSFTVGPRPPAEDGAVTRVGEKFGTVRNGFDRLPPMYDDPRNDPYLVALTPDLSPAAAAVLAAAGYGWEQANEMLLAASVTPGEAEASDVKVLRRRTPADRLFVVGSEAVRWAIHRRRSYAGKDDLWPLEAASRWAWRADRVSQGEASALPRPDQDEALKLHQCQWFPVDDFDSSQF
ncbi:hypothetical protein [Nostocoides jenkinsii]|nr:hypothetical protein [Tetrasphaera jenkinsii]